MNILFICGADPRLTDTGSQQRTNFLWKSLKQCGDVYTTIIDGDERGDVLSAVEHIKFSSIKNASLLARCFEFFTMKLMKVGGWSFSTKKQALHRMGWSDKTFDVVVVRYVIYAARSSGWKIAPMFVDVDDVPLTVFINLCEERLPRWARGVCRKLVSAWQDYVLKRAAGLWVVSEGDLKKLSNYSQVKILANRARDVDVNYDVNGEQELSILSVGLMSYKPNYEGVNWFVEHVWPRVSQYYPNLKYKVAGGGVPKDLRDKWGRVSGVEILGFVKDIDAEYEKCIAVVAPILTGAGSCIKVVEAPLRGRKTFATNYAAHAITSDDRDSMGISLFNDSDTFVSSFRDWINEDESQRKTLQAKYQLAAKEYNSFNRFVDPVVDLIESEG